MRAAGRNLRRLCTPAENAQFSCLYVDLVAMCGSAGRPFDSMILVCTAECYRDREPEMRPGNGGVEGGNMFNNVEPM